MEKRGTPESTGTCDNCGNNGIVVPVEEKTMKVASANKGGNSGYSMLCLDCSEAEL